MPRERMFPLVSDSMSDVPERTDLNVSRRLRRMLRASGLPRVGRAHNLRMRFVQATHVLLILRHQCTHAQIVLAMQELLQGWAETEEEDCGVGASTADCDRRHSRQDCGMDIGRLDISRVVNDIDK